MSANILTLDCLPGFRLLKEAFSPEVEKSIYHQKLNNMMSRYAYQHPQKGDTRVRQHYMAIRPNYYSDFTTFENVDYKLQNLIEDSGLFQGYILTNYALVLAYPRGSTDFKSSAF